MKPISALSGYLRGVQLELKKVTWPTFPVLAQYFFNVVAALILATAFIWAVDYAFIQLLGYFLTK